MKVHVCCLFLLVVAACGGYRTRRQFERMTPEERERSAAQMVLLFEKPCERAKLAPPTDKGDMRSFAVLGCDEQLEVRCYTRPDSAVVCLSPTPSKAADSAPTSSPTAPTSAPRIID